MGVKKKKKQKRIRKVCTYITESPSLTLIPFGKISLTKRVFLSFLGNIEILSFLFHRQSFRGPVFATYTIHSSLLSTSSTYPSLFFTTVFPRYSLCFHGASSSVRQKKSSQSHLLSHAFHDLPNISRLFRPHQPYTHSCFFPGGNGQLPSQAFGRRLWAQGIINPTLWARIAFHPPSFFSWRRNFNLGIRHTRFPFIAFLSSPSFHHLLPKGDCHLTFSPFQRGASQPPSAFRLSVAFFFLQNKRSVPTFLQHYPRFCRRLHLENNRSLLTWETSTLFSILCSRSHQFERNVIHFPLRSSIASNLESCVVGIELGIILI